MSVIENLEALLAKGQDTAMLRLGLGNAYMTREDCAKAVEHLQQAVKLDPTYSAAWKSYAKALAACGRTDDAVAAYEAGISAAEDRGDRQAAKEMAVFLKRLKQAQ